MTLFNECVMTVVLLNSEHYIREREYSIINRRDSHGSLPCSRLPATVKAMGGKSLSSVMWSLLNSSYSTGELIAHIYANNPGFTNY